MLRTEHGHFLSFPKLLLAWVIMVVSAVSMTACSTTSAISPTIVEAHPKAVTVPYRISPAGRIILNVGVDEKAPQPFILDTGANVSVIYDGSLEEMGLTTTGDTVLIKGLVSVGRRPIVEDVDFRIGDETFTPTRIAVLETPFVTDGAIGLLGADILSNYVVLFNRETLMATLIPSESADESLFDGWRKIPLKKQARGREDIGLHFAEAIINRKNVPVLIDTGSNSNLINWRLAALHHNIKRFERNFRKKGDLQGAMKTASLKMDTVLTTLKIGQRYWPEIEVTVIELNPLESIAPVDKPLMIAGAGMFTPWTVAFDFGRDRIYFHPSSGDVKPPEHYSGYTPP